MKRTMMLGLALSMLAVLPAFAAIVPTQPTDPGYTEEYLFEAYNRFYRDPFGLTPYGSNAELPQLTGAADPFSSLFDPAGSTVSITFTPLSRNAWLSQDLGVYFYDSAGAMTQVPIFQNINDIGDVFRGSYTLDAAGPIGIYDFVHGTDPGDGTVITREWFTESFLNYNGEDHFLTYETGVADTFFLAIEDLRWYDDAISDGDFNDLLVEVSISRENGVVPEPASMALLGMGLAGLVAHRLRKK